MPQKRKHFTAVAHEASNDEAVQPSEEATSNGPKSPPGREPTWYIIYKQLEPREGQPRQRK